MTETDTFPIYRQLADDAAGHLEIMLPVELVLADNWGMEPEPDGFTIYCPGRDGDEHVLLHYLSHARMLEDGWKQPVFRFDDRIPFLLANRAADSFTDFWAYRHVADTFGPENLLDYTAWIADTNAADIATFLLEKQGKYGFSDDEFRRYCLVFALDWFAMAPVLTRPFHPDRADRLLDRYAELEQELSGTTAPDDIEARLTAVRSQFRALQDAHDAYPGMIGERQQSAFREYYKTAWPDGAPAALEGFASPLKESKK